MNGGAQGRWGALLVGIVVAISGAKASAQQTAGEDEVVQVTVVSASDRSVYLNQGRGAGLQPGDSVVLFGPGGEVEAIVRSVSHTSARAEVVPGAPLPPVGTHGEVAVTVPPQGRAAAPPTTAPTRTVPQHPPWSATEGLRDDDQPLLVPAYGQRPDERPMTLAGRLFAFGQWNRDQGSGNDNQYLLLRAGVRSDVTNAFGQAERVRLAGEYDERQALLDSAPDRVTHKARIDLASVAFGTEAYAPIGVEAGRFFSQGLPEIGLVDGAEVMLRYQGGVRVGGGMGSYPLPFPGRTGQDFGVHAFVDYVADPQRTVAGAFGLQKTWHNGAPDRDLLLCRGEWRPFAQVTLLGSAKADYYTAGDSLKAEGLQLTEAMLQARWDGRALGFGVTGTHFAWPQLKRTEYLILSEDLIRNGHVDRVSLQARWRPTDWLSLRGRADHWQDQVRDGTTLGLDADVRGLLGSASLLTLSVFETDGSYTSGPGFRAGYRDRLGAGSWRAGYRWHRYTIGTLVTGDESNTRQSAEVGITYPIAANGDLDLSCQQWFGDGTDALTIGFYLQWRF